MGSNYLSGVVDGFNLPSLPTGLAAQASAVIDAYLKRPEGLVYNTDANGNPCSMAAAVPTQTYTLSAPISPGTNVVATVTPPLVRPDTVGEVWVIDNANAGREACVVMSTIGNNGVMFATVQFAHSSGALAQTGLVITEDRNCPSKRSIIRVAKAPIASVVGLLGRYAYGRRSDQVGGLYQEMNLLAAVQTFGGPPQWIIVPIAQCSWSNQTNELWIPAGMLMAYYSDVRVRYIAGYLAGGIPDPIIRATVAVANSMLQSSATGSQFKMVQAGDTRFERFTTSMMDDDTKRLLEPFKAKTMF